MPKLVTPRPNLRRKVQPRTPAEIQEQAIQDLLAVCSSAEGRRVLWQIVSESGLHSRIRAPNPDIHFLEGRRDMGAWLQDWLNEADPNLIPLMMQETVNANTVAPTKRDGEPSDEDPT